MSERRDRAVRQVFVTALFVGVVCFVFSLYLLVAVGLWTGIIKLHLLEPAPYSKNWPETFWWLVVWGGSSGLSILSFWGIIRFGKKVIPVR
jgi:hypothetical protein